MASGDESAASKRHGKNDSAFAGSDGHEEKCHNARGGCCEQEAQASGRGPRDDVDGSNKEAILHGGDERWSPKQKVLLGKDGTEFRANERKRGKDHGFIKKVKDKKKDKDKDELIERQAGVNDSSNSARSGPVTEKAVDEQEEEQENRDKNSETRVQKKMESTGQFIIIKPQKKPSSPLEIDPYQDAGVEDDDSQRSISMRFPSSNSDDFGEIKDAHDDEEAAGGRVHVGKRKNGKLVLSLQEFHATSSAELAPGLSEEELEHVARMEQERKDEVSTVLLLCHALLTFSWRPFRTMTHGHRALPACSRPLFLLNHLGFCTVTWVCLRVPCISGLIRC